MCHVPRLLLQDVANFDDPQTSVPLLSADNLDTNCDALILSLDDVMCKNARLVGGKGSQLAVLHQANIQVSKATYMLGFIVIILIKMRISCVF